MRVEVGLHALVAVRVEGGQVAGLPRRVRGVRAAGHRAGDAQTQLLAFLVGDQRHVDRLQEGRAFLDLLFQGLLHRRLDGKRLGRIVHAVQLGNLGQVGIEKLTGLVLHGDSVREYRIGVLGRKIGSVGRLTPMLVKELAVNYLTFGNA